MQAVQALQNGLAMDMTCSIRGQLYHAQQYLENTTELLIDIHLTLLAPNYVATQSAETRATADPGEYEQPWPPL